MRSVLRNIHNEFTSARDAHIVLHHESLDPMSPSVFRRFSSASPRGAAIVEVPSQLSSAIRSITGVHHLPEHLVRLRNASLHFKVEINPFGSGEGLLRKNVGRKPFRR